MMSVVLMGMSEHERLQTLEHRRAVSCVYRLLPLYPYDANDVPFLRSPNGRRVGTNA
jgi:hypothetical protein